VLQEGEGCEVPEVCYVVNMRLACCRKESAARFSEFCHVVNMRLACCRKESAARFQNSAM